MFSLSSFLIFVGGKIDFSRRRRALENTFAIFADWNQLNKRGRKILIEKISSMLLKISFQEFYC